TVPNRNMVLLSVGIAWAAGLEFDAVAFGAHGGEHTNYPDCQPPFAEAMDLAARVCDFRPIRVLAPFVTLVKTDIVRRGAELGVPFELTRGVATLAVNSTADGVERASIGRRRSARQVSRTRPSMKPMSSVNQRIPRSGRGP